MSLVDMGVIMVVDQPSGVGSRGRGEARVEVLNPEGLFDLHHGTHYYCFICSSAVTLLLVKADAHPTWRILTSLALA